MEVDGLDIVAQVILGANTLEDARHKSYQHGRMAVEGLLTTMKQAEVELSAPMKFLLASNIIEATRVAIAGPVLGPWNQLIDINQQPTYYLGQILQLCEQWASTQWQLQSSKRLMMKIAHVISLWNRHFRNELAGPTIVSWPQPPVSLDFVKDSELVRPEARNPDTSFSINIKLHPQRLLRHATSIDNALQIIQIMDQQITFGKASSDPGDSPTYVWCGVVLDENEISGIPQLAKRYVQENRYGSIIFEFPIQFVPRLLNVGYVLGTRKYKYEYSQAMLIPKSSTPPPKKFAVVNYDGDGLTPLNEIDIKTFDWTLSYSEDGEWTHPELTFENDLEVPSSQIKISFANHNCNTEKSKTCLDCTNNIRRKGDARDRFKKLMNSRNVTELVKSRLGSAFCPEDYAALFG